MLKEFVLGLGTEEGYQYLLQIRMVLLPQVHFEI